MVDDIDNRIDGQGVPGWQVALLLAGAFRELVDQAHLLLAERGHPGTRPAHGFALQAVGAGATASEVGARLGVSKQAAAKTLAGLEAEGYLTAARDPADARRRVLVPTSRAQTFLAESARAFDEVLDRWRATDPDDVDALARALRRLDLPAATRLDLGAWAG